jgi:hypothetical protein
VTIIRTLYLHSFYYFFSHFITFSSVFTQSLHYFYHFVGRRCKIRSVGGPTGMAIIKSLGKHGGICLQTFYYFFFYSYNYQNTLFHIYYFSIFDTIFTQLLGRRCKIRNRLCRRTHGHGNNQISRKTRWNLFTNILLLFLLFFTQFLHNFYTTFTRLLGRRCKIRNRLRRRTHGHGNNQIARKTRWTA